MPLSFNPINLDKKSSYQKLTAQCPQVSSDYSFINLWGWGPEYGLEWAWEDDLVWIRQTIPTTIYWAPMGAWNRIDWANRLGPLFFDDTQFGRVPDKLEQIWQNVGDLAIESSEARGQWDYLYDQKDLINLSGNRFHKKKNLLRQFTRKYDFHYVDMTPDTIAAALAMQTAWCTWRDCEAHAALDAENRSIARVLNGWKNLPEIIGGSLWVKDKMVAYTVAEHFAGDTMLIHFEKGNPDYKGVYQAINQLFLSNLNSDFKLVNREQDLDDPGLRKAKLSYHPVDFIRKFNVILAG
jgi:uncharacterized protein